MDTSLVMGSPTVRNISKVTSASRVVYHFDITHIKASEIEARIFRFKSWNLSSGKDHWVRSCSMRSTLSTIEHPMYTCAYRKAHNIKI